MFGENLKGTRDRFCARIVIIGEVWELVVSTYVGL